MNDWEHRIVGTNTGSEHTFALANERISSHRNCNISVSGSILPGRLLAFKPGQVSLVDTSAMTTRPAYMTLSHCWGQAQFLTLK